MSASDDHSPVLPSGNSTTDGPAAIPIDGTVDGGSAFAFDPWECYAREAGGGAMGPNAIVCGRLGRGKSTMVNMYLWRRGSE